MLKSTIATLLIVAGLPASANAQPTEPTHTVRVAYHDLNLASPQGVAAFDRRIARAVGTVCPDEHDMRLLIKQELTKCRRLANAQAEEQRARVLTAAAPGVIVASAR